ncbi:MAG TPA: hypothetical protein VHE37_02225 [Nevskiaceae bacterium]|nr:hypothetical protein [Nevskiaceae bacterium]
MWTRALTRTKIRAALAHFSLSLLIFAPILFLVVRRWYPGPLFFTDGGWQGTRIMVLIDLVLGPFLTFTVFNPAKTRLALGVDFGFIGTVQIAALVYGVMNISSTAIEAVSWYEGAFVAVSASDYRKQNIAPQDWAKFGDGPPYWVYARTPLPADLGEVMSRGLGQNIAPAAQFNLTSPLREHLADLAAGEIRPQTVAGSDAPLAQRLNDFAAGHGGADGVHFYAMNGFYRSVIVALDGQGRYLGFVFHEPPAPPPPKK